jgi:hypothetical protein
MSDEGSTNFRPDLGRLEQVPVREAWPDEARDFTPWLLANADRLSEALNMDLDLKKAEHPVGDFSLDLIGEDAVTGQRVIIENQLERSDHRHLGQLLTYAGGTEPAVVIWLAQSFREEHISALHWLNASTSSGIGFFAVQVDVFRIGNSVLAPQFTLVVQPNEWQRTLRQRSEAEIAPRRLLYQEYWQTVIDQIAETHPEWTNARKAPLQNWIAFPTGLRGVHYSVEFTSAGLEAGFSLNSRDPELNAMRFNLMKSHMNEIEAAMGAKTEWKGPHSSWSGFNIHCERPASIEDRSSWPEFTTWIINVQERMRGALQELGLIKRFEAEPFRVVDPEHPKSPNQ